MEKSLLIDLDGVLRIDGKPAPYINDFIDFLNSNSINSCVLSNSTLNSSNQIKIFFDKHSIPIEVPIITAIDVAHEYVKRKYKRVAVYADDNVINLFSEVLDFDSPEAVLIGDIGDRWNYRLLQTIFEYIKGGAELIAAHKNRYWKKPKIGIQLDAGPFIHAIEYATSVEATLIGKPSSLYFEIALKKIGVSFPNSFIMLGDDLESDMKGAKKMGAETIFIYTGKTSYPINNEYKSIVDYECKDLKDVISKLKKIYGGNK